MIRKEEVFKIGVMGKPHGINGEIAMAFSDDVFDRTDADYVVLLIDGIFVPFFIEEYRFKGAETALMKLCDIDSAEKARELTGVEVYFPKSLSDGQEDEVVTWEDIVGFSLINDDDEATVGSITDVDDSTANVLFTVKTNDGREVLVPASEELITAVDNENRIIKMTIPEGLLNIED
jgi:16S rRNA processing protein RimM